MVYWMIYHVLYWTRHAGHCWRSRDELIRDVLLWIPAHGHAKAGRPARKYIQQLCEDTGCCPEDLPRAMNDREEWRERVRDIRATSTIWWWWWYRILNRLCAISNGTLYGILNDILYGILYNISNGILCGTLNGILYGLFYTKAIRLEE